MASTLVERHNRTVLRDLEEGDLVERHNQTVLRDLEEGDLVEFPRGSFSHWAVYIGENIFFKTIVII